VKSETLDVRPELLDKHGAVSEEVVRAMAEGVQRQFAVDAALAITGIAGPTGGTAEKRSALCGWPRATAPRCVR